MTYTIIRSEKQYQEYLNRVEILFDAEPGTAEFDELELLSMLITKYEAENYPLPEPDPVDIIQYYLEQRALKPKNFIEQMKDEMAKTFCDWFKRMDNLENKVDKS
jgi:HTH-type transcriptional regulator / antitoxin HigA